MRHSYFIFLFLLGIALPSLNAQGWGQMSSLTNFFNNHGSSFFDSQLNSSQNDFTFDTSDLDGAVDGLNDQIANNPLDNADSFDEFWNSDNSFIDAANGFNGMGSGDSTSIDNQYGDINDIWNNQMDSLNTGIGSYQDELNNVNLNTFQQNGAQGEFNQDASMESIENEFNSFFKRRRGQPTADLDGILSSLFSSALDLELAYGQENADIHFWGDNYSVRANVIRVASVPTFRSNFETSWAFETSFFNTRDNLQQETSVSLKDGLNTLMYHGNFSLLYLPRVGAVNRNKEFRIYTSIGLDVGTYAPSHENGRFPERVGLTTGFGPEVGLGFIVNLEAISMYSYGTIAYGDIEATEISPEYKYAASAINAGIRIGDALNIRYTLGQSSWAFDGRKTANFSRFTVGVLLDSLSRD